MAWHGLTEVREDLSLDNNWLAQWDIQAMPLQIAPDDALSMEHLIDTPFSILTATDDPNIVIGVPFNPESYRPITNAEFLQLLKEATADTRAKLISIGSVRNRGRVFASFQIEKLETYKAGGRTFKPYLNFGNGHDKSSVLWANTSNNCTVCDNTFQMNLADTERRVVEAVRQRHTKNIAVRLPAIGAVVKQAIESNRSFAMAFEAMAGTAISELRAERILTGFVVNQGPSTRAHNIINRLMELFRSGRGNSGKTLADLFSGVTEYYTHESAGSDKNPSRQFVSSEFGASSDRKKSFFAILTNPAARDKTEKLGADILKQQKETK
jgi:hypothetical protein